MKRIRKTPRERLADHLIDAGFQVSLDDFWEQEGDYKKRMKWDLACWGANVGHNGRKATLYSWDTMTLCARRGIVLTPDSGTHRMPEHFEVHAKE